MLKLESLNKVGIYFDHAELINEAFQELVSAKSDLYKLKNELFHFYPKVILKDAKENNNLKVEPKAKTKTKKSKLKRSATLKEEDEVKQLINRTKTFLELLKQHGKFIENANSLAAASEVQPRYLEQLKNEFPKFNGSNPTNDFKNFTLNKQSYLVPPFCHFYNYDITALPQLLPGLPLFDLIILDPPWRNKYIRKLKRVRDDLAYKMLNNEQLAKIPIARLIHNKTIVAIWCTNSSQHQEALTDKFLPTWNLRLLHTLKWLKLNTAGELTGTINVFGHGYKQPFETLYLACHRDHVGNLICLDKIKEVEMILSVPSLLHSHKPPLIHWLREFLPKNPKCLELFARYLQPGFTSIGLEVIKLMDMRLYTSIKK